MRILTFASLVFLGLLSPAVASRSSASLNQVPVLDIERTCRAAQDYGMNDPKETFRNCMLDETEARTQLGQKWSKFKAESRRGCIPPHPIPSYVEMLTCLEMDQNTLVPYQGGGAAIGAPSSYSHDSAPARPAPSIGPRPAGSF
ncbi:MAG: hypothetical protein P4L68_06040 [Methylovirgula sp.]|nr:hypothetical protein [Methylovirgula sp.]